ncbi:MAG: hypothetical protein ACREF7_00255 [Candidatus Saccharimonadales bacterium]
MRRDRDWVAGARLRLARNPKYNPEQQEGCIFKICHDLLGSDVQIIDTRPGFSMAAVFEVSAPTKHSAKETALTIIDRTIYPYAGSIILARLKVVPRDEVLEMMLETRPHTWPEISRNLPEEIIGTQISDSSEHLAEVIPLFSVIRQDRAQSS